MSHSGASIHSATEAGVPVPKPPGTTARLLRRFLEQRLAVGSVLLLLAVGIIAILAPQLAPHDPATQSLANRLSPPSAEHWLGTDTLGRDAFSRLLYAARISITAPFIAVGVAVLGGLPLGLTAGFAGGAFDWIVGRVTDALMSLPPLILAIALIAAFGPSMVNAMLAIGVVYLPRVLRLTRGATLAVRGELYVEASASVGCGPLRVMAVHILPNIVGPIIVQVSLLLGFAVLAEASLSFLGLGVQPPQASWGLMLRRAFEQIHRAPHLIYPPGVMIVLVVLAFNFAGDGLRSAIGKEIRSVDG